MLFWDLKFRNFRAFIRRLTPILLSCRCLTIEHTYLSFLCTRSCVFTLFNGHLFLLYVKHVFAFILSNVILEWVNVYFLYTRTLLNIQLWLLPVSCVDVIHRQLPWVWRRFWLFILLSHLFRNCELLFSWTIYFRFNRMHYILKQTFYTLEKCYLVK